MTWIRVLVYRGPEDWIRQCQAKSLPEGTRKYGFDASIWSASVLGGRWRLFLKVLWYVLSRRV
jgi:hypothetical protein